VKKGNDEGVWVVDVKNGKGSVKFDANGMHIRHIFMYATNVNTREKQEILIYVTVALFYFG
jgi:hypothetical protein